MDCGAWRPRDAMRALRCYFVICQLGGAHQLFSYPAYSCSSLPLMCIFSHLYTLSCFLRLLHSWSPAWSHVFLGVLLGVLLSWSRVFLGLLLSWSRVFLGLLLSWSRVFLGLLFFLVSCFLRSCFSWPPVFFSESLQEVPPTEPSRKYAQPQAATASCGEKAYEGMQYCNISNDSLF
jgi:hypothetical protein